MSTTYSAGVFFGAFAMQQSPLGQRLDRYVDKAGGTPAETEARGVEIDIVGSEPTGEVWMVVRAKGSAHSFERGEDVEAPRMLTEEPMWRASIQAFFDSINAPAPPIGWHFAGSVS